jgi:hypothetical protein
MELSANLVNVNTDKQLVDYQDWYAHLVRPLLSNWDFVDYVERQCQ